MENNYVKLSTGIINKRKPVCVRFEEQLSQLVDSYNQEKLIDYLKNSFASINQVQHHSATVSKSEMYNHCDYLIDY
ncbi:hypothetical protein BpHYR1_013075, partial [Brachionus plicatilis]